MTLKELIRSGHVIVHDETHTDHHQFKRMSQQDVIREQSPTGSKADLNFEEDTDQKHTNRYLLRIKKDETWLHPRTLSSAINSLATTSCPQESRGPLDLERAAPLIEIPVARSAQAALDIFTNLHQSLTTLSRDL